MKDAITLLREARKLQNFVSTARAFPHEHAARLGMNAREIDIFMDGLDTASVHAEPYVVGNKYLTQAGMFVRVAMSSDKRGYETVMGEDQIWRYNRASDRGRVCGSPHDYSYPANFVRLYTSPVVPAGTAEALKKRFAKWEHEPINTNAQSIIRDALAALEIAETGRRA